MTRMTSAVVNGRERFFNFSMDVMFDVQDEYGNSALCLEKLLSEGRESFETVVWLGIRMQKDAERLRRAAGEEKEPYLTEKDFSTTMYPGEFVNIKEALTEAMTLGWKRELADSEDVDEGLEELNAKKKKAGA